MLSKFKFIIPSVIMALFPLVTLANHLTLSVNGPAKLSAEWDVKGLTVPMTFKAKGKHAYCYDDNEGFTCAAFVVDAELFLDYNAIYKQLFRVDGTDWPIYDKIKEAGGSKTYGLAEVASQATLEKATSTTPHSPILLKDI